MKRVRHNINDKVWVKLTEEGKQIYHDHWHKYDELFQRIGYETPPLKTVNGWTEFQMWDFMSIFGSAYRIGMGGPTQTEIEIEVYDD
jgi:hypothetical protein